MPTDESFRDLMRRVQAEEPAACAELFRRYEPEIRRAVRIRLTDLRLRRLVDSADICQSVLTNFFVCAAAGRYELGTPEQLLKLLVTMARNRVIDKWRNHQREIRSRDSDFSRMLPEVPSGNPGPGEPVELAELTQKLLDLLTPGERYLVEQRKQGRTWDDLAAELEVSAVALQKRHARAIDRAARQLGL